MLVLLFLKQCTNRVKDTQRQHVVGPAVSWVELEFGGVERGHPALLKGVTTWVLEGKKGYEHKKLYQYFNVWILRGTIGV